MPPNSKLTRVFNDGCIVTEGVAAGIDGWMYFSDVTITSMCNDACAIYRLDPNGKVSRILIDGDKPNGVLVSPDQKTLYVVSNDNGRFDKLKNNVRHMARSGKR